MSDIDDRWHKVAGGDKVRSARYGIGKRWLARWRDDSGKQRYKSFDTKEAATSHLANVRVDLERGAYIDPRAGKVKLRTYGESWIAAQTTEATTQEITAFRLRLHVFPALGDRELRGLRPSVIQSWMQGLQGTLAPNYVRVIFTNLSMVLQAAVDDGLIAKNPCRAASVNPPAPVRRRVVPWPTERVNTVRAALPSRYREIVTAAAGLGMRQGEVFGLSPDDIDWLRGVVHVVRQVKIVGNKLVFALPKGGKERDVPLPESVALRLARHLQENPARAVTLPWRTTTGKPVTASLMFTSRETAAMNRNYFNAKLWKPALLAADIAPTREHGMHVLRHTFASVVLDGGASIKEVAEWLGHTDAGFTLRTYTHLLPHGEDRMRTAIDKAFGGTGSGGGVPDVYQAGS